MNSPKRQPRPRTALRERARKITKREKQLLDSTQLNPDEAAAELCRREFSFFVREFWEEIIPDVLVWNWHMTILCDEIQHVYERVFMRYDDEGNQIGRLPKLYDLIINIPPGTSKSTIVSVMAPAWSWTVDPTLRHISASYTGTLATEMAVKSRDIITSDKYMRYFPDILIKKDENGKTNYKNIYGGQRFATSVGATVTGVHAHILTIDDPINPKEAVSIAGLETATKWFDDTIPTRKVDKAVSVMILIMQRLAVGDPTGHQLKKAKERGLRIRHICLPSSISDNVKPKSLKQFYIDGLLDPDRMPQTVLNDMLAELGPTNYAGQFEQRPAPADGAVWKRWFIAVPDEVFPSRSLMTQYGTDWDTAYTKDDKNSASAYVTAGKIDERIYIDDFGAAWLEFPSLIKYMKLRPSPHYIEAKATGKSSKQTLVNQGIPAIEIKVAGGDKIARTNMATPTAAAGIVYVRASILEKLYTDAKQGILFFPNGEHTDVNDALTQCLQRLGKKSTIHAADDGQDDEDDPLNW